MTKKIVHEKYGEIVYEESAWTGRKALTVNGVALQKIAKKEFRTADGGVATIKGGFLQGAALEINGESITLIPKIKWYEVVLILIPFVLIMAWGNSSALCRIVPIVGGAIGGAVNGGLSVLGFLAIRSVKPIWLKILVAVATFAVIFIVCYLIACAIIGAFG